MKKDSIYSQLFSKLGLSESQAKVYEFLIKNGTKTAGEISKKTEIKRGLTYNALSELEKKGIISQNTKTKITTFSPNHPESLREYIETKEKEVKDTKLSFETILPSIISDFNIISDKPGVRYFEGYDGIKKVFEDFLRDNNGGEILNFCHMEDYANDKKLFEIGLNFIKNREILKIKQRTIIPVNEKKISEDLNLDDKKPSMEEISYISNHSFDSDVILYNNKIAIISAKKAKKPIGIIIENKEIFNTFRSIFDLVWNTNKKPRE